jgi:alpha-beta hydrolase superfamily lysophospholipase
MRMGLATLALLVLGQGMAQAQDRLPAIVAAYLDVQASLAADRTDGTAANARTIGEQAREMSNGSAIAEAAASLEKASTLAAARTAFGPLSEAVVAAATAAGWKGLDDVKLAYCPMARHSWLQKEDAVRNPYYGKAMANCGEFRAKS